LIRIAIVNDVRMAVEVLRRIVVGLPDAEVAWIASDGQEAVEKCLVDPPDVLLMDLIMPVMDGVEATRLIMKQSPCPILVVTATISGNCNRVYESLGHGALDAVNTPVLGRDGSISGGEDLRRKIRNLVCLRGSGVIDSGERTAGSPPTSEIPTRQPSALPDPTAQPASRPAPLLAIGASTGGPQALAKVLADLSPPLDYSVAIVQHLDELFVPGLVEWLSYETKMAVREIEAGQSLKSGVIGVASTRDHLVLNSHGVFQYVRDPVEQIHRPSVDVFFRSLAKAGVGRGVALLLTGMGRDGAAGMKSLRDSGWQTVAQDQQSSIVWGMPGAAVQLGAADRVLPLDRIGSAISEMMTNKKT
jgi:two-component system response regulator WspF